MTYEATSGEANEGDGDLAFDKKKLCHLFVHAVTEVGEVAAVDLDLHNVDTTPGLATRRNNNIKLTQT